MKYALTLLALTGFATALHAQTAAPDFDRIGDYTQKMDSLRSYCNILLGSDSSKGDNFPQALVYGLKGLHMARPGDHKSLAQFAMVTGVSYYNRASFDSAAYYMQWSAREARLDHNTLLIAWSHSNLIPIYLQTQQAA